MLAGTVSTYAVRCGVQIHNYMRLSTTNLPAVFLSDT